MSCAKTYPDKATAAEAVSPMAMVAVTAVPGEVKSAAWAVTASSVASAASLTASISRVTVTSAGASEVAPAKEAVPITVPNVSPSVPPSYVAADSVKDQLMRWSSSAMDTSTPEMSGKPSGSVPPTSRVSTFSAPEPSSTTLSSRMVKSKVCAPLVNALAGMDTNVSLKA